MGEENMRNEAWDTANCLVLLKGWIPWWTLEAGAEQENKKAGVNPALSILQHTHSIFCQLWYIYGMAWVARCLLFLSMSWSESVQVPQRAETVAGRGRAGLELRPHKKRLLSLGVCPQPPLAELPLFGSIQHFQMCFSTWQYVRQDWRICG